MRLTSPRVPPLADPDLTPDQAAALAPLRSRGPVLNIFRTLAHDAHALTAFLAWGGYVLSRRNALAPREREMAILRTGHLCRAGYEWAQHVAIGRAAGLAPEEIERIKAGPTAPEWTPAESALLAAVDELHHDHFVSDAAWRRLSAYYDEKARRDLVYTVGQYTQVAMILNTFGVQLEAGAAVAPDDLDAPHA